MASLAMFLDAQSGPLQIWVRTSKKRCAPGGKPPFELPYAPNFEEILTAGSDEGSSHIDLQFHSRRVLTQILRASSVSTRLEV